MSGEAKGAAPEDELRSVVGSSCRLVGIKLFSDPAS